MGWVTGIVLYLLIWWTVLFAVLPWGIRPVDTPDAGTGWRGTPENPLLLRKVVATTLIAAVIWVGCVLLIRSSWLSFRHGWLRMPD
jgi:predicted secreted protein